MHGVRRQRRAPPSEPDEVAAARRSQERRRIDEYTALCNRMYEKRATEDYTAEALDLTAQILTLNPEFQSAWSFRRQILQHNLRNDVDAAAQQNRLETDLQLTNAALRSNPKNYSVWEHRKWVLHAMPSADWGAELALVDMYLQKDGRNFHTWDYRRYLLGTLLTEEGAAPPSSRSDTRPAPTLRTELAFTTRKISENFSNFSAWHYRTKLLARLWADDDSSAEYTTMLTEEFELVRQALWSDPNDQSAWLYHRWLIGLANVTALEREIEDCEQLRAEEPGCRWILDSLVTYKRMLAERLAEQSAGDISKIDGLRMTCLELLRELETVDPMRRARYQDLCNTAIGAGL
ncbi:hypothetical protein JCM3774_001227 [Rhodotorula dairenensis]